MEKDDQDEWDLQPCQRVGQGPGALQVAGEGVSSRHWVSLPASGLPGDARVALQYSFYIWGN